MRLHLAIIVIGILMSLLLINNGLLSWTFMFAFFLIDRQMTLSLNAMHPSERGAMIGMLFHVFRVTPAHGRTFLWAIRGFIVVGAWMIYQELPNWERALGVFILTVINASVFLDSGAYDILIRLKKVEDGLMVGDRPIKDRFVA